MKHKPKRSRLLKINHFYGVERWNETQSKSLEAEYASVSQDLLPNSDRMKGVVG